MRIHLFILLFWLTGISVIAQKKVSFITEDSLRVTADLYLKNYELPFILLFHQGESSRGEYLEIAKRLIKLEYNCLAVDLRSGDKMNFITNETAARAKESNVANDYWDSQKDILASIDFVSNYNKKPVILFGSSYSASLCLVLSKDNPSVKAVVAFSPGEYFRPLLVVRDQIKGLNIPIFVSGTTMEQEYIDLMFADVLPQYIYEYKPSRGKGIHGAKALWIENEDADQCWLELMLFFKKLNY